MRQDGGLSTMPEGASGPPGQSSAAGPCRNCGAPAATDYCPNCGQRQGNPRVSLPSMLTDLLDDQFSLNARLPRTLSALLFRPGHLTTEYFQGRIVRYIRPVRLYLFSSVLFFLLLTLVGTVAFERGRVLVGEVDGRLEAIADSIRTDPALQAQPARRDSLLANITAARAAAEAASAGFQGVAAGIEPVRVTTPVPGLGARIEQRIEELRLLPPAQAVRMVVRDFLNRAPVVVFLLLPIFALLLKLLYAPSGRYYVEHFIFALHLHAFWFAAFTVVLLFRYPLVFSVVGSWVLVYVYIAMKRFYREGYLRTGMKYLVLGATYPVILLLAVVGTLLAALALA
jgi:hypothetical protein